MKSGCIRTALRGLMLAALVAVQPGPAAEAAPRNGGRAWEDLAQNRTPGQPLMAIVSLRQQRVTIYDADGKMLKSGVSTGRSGYETPAGIFSVIGKEAEHFSNLYDDAPMPFMQRITWSGIALHAGALPGYPASHGCIRLPYDFAQTLFDKTKLGMRVIVARDDREPVAIEHATLFQPLPEEPLSAAAPAASGPSAVMEGFADAAPTAPKPLSRRAAKAAAAKKAETAEAATKAAEDARREAHRIGQEFARSARLLHKAEVTASAKQRQAAKDREKANASLVTVASAREGHDGMLAPAAEASPGDASSLATEPTIPDEALERARAEHQTLTERLAAAREAARIAEEARVQAVNASRAAVRRMAPITVFVSTKAQTLQVRQGFRPLFESPVTLADPDKPIGTHVYTAMAFTTGDEDRLRWSVVSLTGDKDEPETKPAKSKRKANVETVALKPQANPATAALDRVQIPEDALARIRALASPGSTLIVTDEELSKETGTGTDFVVLLSDEPQGGVKIRRKDTTEQPRNDISRGYRPYRAYPYPAYPSYRTYPYPYGGPSAPSQGSYLWW